MKRSFKLAGSICAAGMMAVSAVGMSACTLSDVWREVSSGAVLVVTVPIVLGSVLWDSLTGKGEHVSTLEYVSEKMYVGEADQGVTLWEAIGQKGISAEVTQYKSLMGFGDGEVLAEVSYSQPIDDLLASSDYWLPLPMPESARELQDEVNEKYFASNGLELPSMDGMNGYWYYCLHEHSYVYKPDVPNTWLYGLPVEEFDFMSQWLDCTLAWYNTDTDKLYMYYSVM